jgi:dipeptidyl aminopeptidase/acylaminoacyl peptidase
MNHRIRIRVVVSFLAGAVCLAATVWTNAQSGDAAQRPKISPSDYARAEAFERGPLLVKLKNGLVTPHWIGKSDDFWYKKGSLISYEFWVVQAGSWTKNPAFDHKAMAKALSAATGDTISATRLPFDTLEFSDSRDAINVIVKYKPYRCLLNPVHCSAVTPPVTSISYEITFASPLPPDYKQANEALVVSPNEQWGVLSQNGNLILRNLGTGKDVALTSDGEPNNGYGIYPGGWKAASIYRERAIAAGHVLPPLATYWSPDSRTVIAPRIDQRHVADYPMVETVPGDGSFRPKVHFVRIPFVGEKTAPVEWYAFDVPSGKYRRLELPYDKLLVLQQDLLAIRKTWWSSDNRDLYAVAFGDNMESAFFFDADVTTGKVRTVIEEHMMPRMDLNSTSYNPPNVRVTADGKNVIWFSQRDGWGHLYLYDGETGKLKNQITKGNWLVRDIISVDEVRRRIYFTGGGKEGGNPYYRYLYRVNFDGTDFKLLSPEHADHSLTSPWNDVLAIDGAVGYEAVSPSGKYVIYNYSTPQEPTQTVVRSTEDAGLIATFEKADASELFALGYKPPEEFVTKSADGKEDLWCLVYKPANFDPAKRYPVVDLEYASPLTAVVPRTFMQAVIGVPAPAPGASALTQFGVVVVSIDARGTTYRSREFSQANYGKLNTNGLDDHVAVIKQLAARFPYVDTTRVGIVGGSYGGWSAFRGMLEFPDFYTVGVAGAPAGSMMNQYVDYHWSSFQGRPIYSDGTELRPMPTEVPKGWDAIDGRQQAARLKGHLLVLMGELDENVLPGSTLQLLDALQKAGKDFDLVYLADHNHRTGWGAYTTRRICDFFVRYLPSECGSA